MEQVFLAGLLATLMMLLSIDFLTARKKPAACGRLSTKAFLDTGFEKTHLETPMDGHSARVLLGQTAAIDAEGLDGRTVEALRQLLRHSDPSIVGEAFRLLARVPGEIPALMVFLERQEREIMAAYSAFHDGRNNPPTGSGSTGPAFAPVGKNSFGEEAIDQDLFALQALIEHPETIGEGANLKFLLRNLGERDPLRRGQAVLALGKSGLMLAREGIVKCLQDSDQGVRSCAITALVECLGSGALAVFEERTPQFGTPSEGMAVLQALLPLASPQIDAWLESQEHRFPEAFRPQVRAFRQARRWLEK
jgi:hypothetical protein